jgi:hypothetical protein
MTQLELAIKLDIGGHAVAHYECGRKPDAVTTARLCRVAHEAARDDLADLFASALPGVEEGLLIPVWRLPDKQQPEKPTFEKGRSEPLVINGFDNRLHPVVAQIQDHKGIRAPLEGEEDVSLGSGNPWPAGC